MCAVRNSIWFPAPPALRQATRDPGATMGRDGPSSYTARSPVVPCDTRLVPGTTGVCCHAAVPATPAPVFEPTRHVQSARAALQTAIRWSQSSAAFRQHDGALYAVMRSSPLPSVRVATISPRVYVKRRGDGSGVMTSRTTVSPGLALPTCVSSTLNTAELSILHYFQSLVFVSGKTRLPIHGMLA